MAPVTGDDYDPNVGAMNCAPTWGKKMKTIRKFSLLFLAIPFCIACGSTADDTGENFGNVLDSPSGLTLTEAEHVYGWGRSDCLMCHNTNNIHQEDRTGGGTDVEAIETETQEQGESICVTCHGDNGAI